MTDTKDGGPALLPCPFCGGVEWNVINNGTTWLVVHAQRGKPARYQAMCQNKKCDVKPKTSIWVTREDASKAWNTRAMLSARGSHE